MSSQWWNWTDLVYGAAGYLAGRRRRRRRTREHLSEIGAQAIDISDLSDTQPFPTSEMFPRSPKQDD